MSNDRVWDSRRGWINPNRKLGITIKRKEPKWPIDEIDQEIYEDSEVNEDWFNDPLNVKHDYKKGYTKRTSPTGKLLKWYKDISRFERVNYILNLIPFVTVEVIE